MIATSTVGEMTPTTSNGAAPTSATSNPSSFTVINSSTPINGVSAAEASGLMTGTWAPDKGPGQLQIYHYGGSSPGLPPATSTLIPGNPNSFAVPSPSPSRWNADPVIYCAEVGAPFLPIWPSQIQSKKGRKEMKGRLLLLRESLTSMAGLRTTLESCDG